jgi:antitoxin (DNA-binding transcriptional repressor) of toxin-antitoxin stability system
VKIGEAKTHLSALLADVEAGEDLIICRGSEPIARVTRVRREAEGGNLRAVLRSGRSKQGPVTSSEILAWRHEGHCH